MARLRSAPVARQSGIIPATQIERQPLKEKTNTTSTKAPVYEDDGNTEGLIKDAKPRRGRPKKATQKEDDFIMAGGLGAQSDDKTLDRNVVPPTTDELAKSDGTPPLTARAIGRRPLRTKKKVAQSEAKSKLMEDLKQRMQATTRKGAATVRTQISTTASSSDGISANPLPTQKPTDAVQGNDEDLHSSSPQQPAKHNSVSKHRSSILQPGSALRSHGTPAVESSILALKNFKRRPRQPSMLQMVQQRTASARPSAVHVPAAEDLSVFDLDDDDDVDDFAPDAEGTPLAVSKKRQASSAKKRASKTPRDDSIAMAMSTPASKKRKSQDANQSSILALEALRLKRRKSSAPPEDDVLDEAEEESPALVKNLSPRRSTPHNLDEGVQVINSTHSMAPDNVPSSPRLDDQDDDVVPSTEREEQNIPSSPPARRLEAEREVDADGTMAEPLSSSPLAELSTQRTDIMADPLTQITPPRPRRDNPTKNKKKAAPMTTRTLQNLLPKRRQPLKPRARKSEYDFDEESEDDAPLDTSDLPDNEDELGGKLRRQTKATTTKSKPTKTSAKIKSRQSSKAATSNRISTMPAKTYGRASAASDKENRPIDADVFEDLDEAEDSVLPDTSISMYEAAKSKELEAAKRKFARVDEWDMEFESMSFEEGRSEGSSWR